MDELHAYIEDLSGRADIPDQIYKDLIERFASARLEKIEKKKSYILKVMETSAVLFDDGEPSEENPLHISHAIKTVKITKENYDSLNAEIVEVINECEGHAEMFQIKCIDGLWSVSDETEDIYTDYGYNVVGEKYNFISLDIIE